MTPKINKCQLSAGENVITASSRNGCSHEWRGQCIMAGLSVQTAARLQESQQCELIQAELIKSLKPIKALKTMLT